MTAAFRSSLAYNRIVGAAFVDHPGATGVADLDAGASELAKSYWVLLFRRRRVSGGWVGR
jgi:hypothetical protein